MKEFQDLSRAFYQQLDDIRVDEIKKYQPRVVLFLDSQTNFDREDANTKMNSRNMEDTTSVADIGVL